jgi:hypothetical protein
VYVRLLVDLIICDQARIVQVSFPSALYNFVNRQQLEQIRRGSTKTTSVRDCFAALIYCGVREMFQLSTCFLRTSLQHMKQYYSKSRKQNTISR